MTAKTPIADFTDIECHDQQLRCPECHQWRKVLLCVKGGRMVCRECKNAGMKRDRRPAQVAGVDAAAR
jgi:hypothetical protein